MEKFFQLTREDINPAKYIERVLSPEHGGTVVFVGSVRDLSEGKKVTNLTYETNEELATKIMEGIFQEVEKKWNNLSVAVVHRIGEKLKPGIITLVIAVSSPHREEAYAANRYILERIKEDLPIWKKEEFIDGSEKWVGWPDKG